MNWASLGLTLDTEGLPDAAAQQLRDRWATPPLNPAPLAVVCRTGALPGSPEGAPQHVTVSNAQVAVWIGSDELWISGELYLRLSPRPEILVSPEGVSEAAWLLAIAELQRLSGWLPLHAATVAQDDHAVSVTGVSGAGKSTAALRFAAQSWTVLAEDQTWVHPASMRVTGLDRYLRTYLDSLDRFAPELKAQIQGQDAYGKQMLPLKPPAEPAELRGLLVFGLPPQPAAAESVRAVWECTGIPLFPATRKVAAQAVGELLRGLRVQGTNREGVLEHAAHLVSSR